MLTYKRVMAFLFLAGFAEEEARALRQALTLVIDVGTEPALQGLAYSAVALAANAGLIFGALWLLRRWHHSWRGTPVPIEPPPGGRGQAAETDRTAPLDPVGQGEPDPAGWPEEGGCDEQRPECT
ncbi:MAG TPA: hypothetical protein VII45_01910 [Solirubrobacterales bacterium]